MKLMALRYAGTCVSCGAVIGQRVEAWYDPTVKKVTCTTCKPIAGQLSVAPVDAPAERTAPTRSARTDLEQGQELETRIADAFAAAGYRVQTNVKREGLGGVPYEIDVLAEKTDELLTLSVAVECKAWASPIDREVVAKFNEARRELGLGHGVIASLNGARPGALDLAAQHGITIWGPDELQPILGRASVAHLQNRPKVEEIGFPRLLDDAGAAALVVKEATGIQSVSKEDIVWSGPAWLPVSVVQLTLRKFNAFKQSKHTSQRWTVYDLLGATFVTGLDEQPDPGAVEIDGGRLPSLLKVVEPARNLERVMTKWTEVKSDEAKQKYRGQLRTLGVPDWHTVAVGTPQPFLYPVYVAVARKKSADRLIVVDCFRSRHDPDLSHVATTQIVPVRSALGIT